MLHVGRTPTSMCVLTMAITIYLVFWKTTYRDIRIPWLTDKVVSPPKANVDTSAGVDAATSAEGNRNRNALEKEHSKLE
jgi:hypothetical protein